MISVGGHGFSRAAKAELIVPLLTRGTRPIDDCNRWVGRAAEVDGTDEAANQHG
jgi:hypothetical protein